MKQLLLKLVDRLKEPSTHAAIAALLAFFNIKLAPEYLSVLGQILTGVAMVATGLLAVFLPESKAPETK